MAKIGIADTTFAKVDMASFAIREIRDATTDVQLVRYTVPGIKDLPVAAKKLIMEDGCDLVMAFGMPGPTPIDKHTALASAMGLIWAELMTNRHILEIFVHEDEASNDKDLYQIAEDRSRKHARNALKICFKRDELTKDAGMGKRKGRPDVGPIKVAP